MPNNTQWEIDFSEIIFTAVDPRGKIVVCESSALRHVIKGHPEVTQEQIKDSITTPTLIRQSKTKITSQLYFDASDSSSESVGVFTVVDFNIEYSKGRLVTAFIGRDKRSRGEIIWHPK